MSRKSFGTPAVPASPGPPADDSGCTILHIDMDAFYASVELRHRPDLRGQPVIVAGGGGEIGNRGVVLSATYEARALGIRAAMPVAQARRLAPQAVFLPARHSEYATVSTAIMAIFQTVTPLVEPLSFDEAFLDVSGAIRRLGRPSAIGELIRATVEDEQGITCSVGVASTKFIAKLASAYCKPNGLLVIPRDGAVEFLRPLPVGALWGVGAKTEEALRKLGLRTVADLAATPESTLRHAIGPAAASHLLALAAGRDPRAVVPGEREKSIGAEETFGRDIDDPALVRRELLRLSERTAARLRGAGMVGRTVSIKVRFADFTTITRARTLADATDVARDIYATACQIYDGLGLDRARIRLVGVRLEGLSDTDSEPRQLMLGERPQGWREVEQAAAKAVHRFGAGTVQPAALVPPAARDVAEPPQD